MAKADITLRGRAFSIACAPGQEARLVALSKDLNIRVEQISGAVGDIGDERLLLIAALALLDELDAARRGQASVTSPEIDKAASALSNAATRISALATRIEGDL
jgi:cell division protein ZapA